MGKMQLKLPNPSSTVRLKDLFAGDWFLIPQNAVEPRCKIHNCFYLTLLHKGVPTKYAIGGSGNLTEDQEVIPITPTFTYTID